MEPILRWKAKKCIIIHCRWNCKRDHKRSGKYHIDGVLEGKDCSAFRRDYWMPKVVSIFTENGSFTARTQCYWDEEFSFDKMALWFDESSDMAAFRKKYETQFDFIERDRRFTRWFRKEFPKRQALKSV